MGVLEEQSSWPLLTSSLLQLRLSGGGEPQGKPFQYINQQHPGIAPDFILGDNFTLKVLGATARALRRNPLRKGVDECPRCRAHGDCHS